MTYRASAAITEDWRHFRLERSGRVATVPFTRPDKLNALTFDVYADLRDLIAELPHRDDTRVLVLKGEGRAFCSGGDVDEIIGATLQMRPDELLSFTRMTGDVVRAMRESPVPIVAAIQGTAAGAGSVIALASDFRIVTRWPAGPSAAKTRVLLPVTRGLSDCHSRSVVSAFSAAYSAAFSTATQSNVSLDFPAPVSWL